MLNKNIISWLLIESRWMLFWEILKNICLIFIHSSWKWHGTYKWNENWLQNIHRIHGSVVRFDCAKSQIWNVYKKLQYHTVNRISLYKKLKILLDILISLSHHSHSVNRIHINKTLSWSNKKPKVKRYINSKRVDTSIWAAKTSVRALHASRTFFRT